MLPACFDDYITEAFIDELDLCALGFERVQPAAVGRPAYHPATLLKIYLYGYLNRIQSSRRLEREAGPRRHCDSTKCALFYDWLVGIKVR